MRHGLLERRQCIRPSGLQALWFQVGEHRKQILHRLAIKAFDLDGVLF